MTARYDTFGAGTFGAGTYGGVTEGPPLKIVEADGSVRDATNYLPVAFLPDGTGLRVSMRFILATEALSTYDGLRTAKATYTAMRSGWASYDLMRSDISLGQNVDFDVTCMVTGVQATLGRGGLFDDIEAGTCSVSINDPNGLFDPRAVNTAFGPGRRVRTGTYLRVEVFDAGQWWPLFTGLTDKWERQLDADGTPQVSVSGTDFFAGLATTRVTGALPQESTGARISRHLTNAWSAQWGPTIVPAGTIDLYAETVDDDSALDRMRAAATVEDGRVFVDPSGDFIYQLGTWRVGRTAKFIALGPGGDKYGAAFEVCRYSTIRIGWPNYNSLKSSFLVYNDMRTCVGSGQTPAIPTVCATSMTVADESDDVINTVVIEWGAPGAIIGYVTDTDEEVRAQPTAKEVHVATDAASITRYGQRKKSRGDLTPAASTMLDTLCQTLVKRWASGEATVTSIGFDFTREDASPVVPLRSGDLIEVVDRIPAHDVDPEQWTVTTAEVMGITWNMTPDAFGVELTLDELSA